MRPRQIHRLLTAAAGTLLVLQVVLLLLLWLHPPAPDTLPDYHGISRPVVASSTPLPDDSRAAVEALDHLLSLRVEQAAARQGVDAGAHMPADALRQAALDAPDPNGAEVRALVDAYGHALAGLGETLDATSSLATAGSPGTRDPGAAAPGAPTPPGP